MNPVFHEPLKRLARLVSSNWFRGLTLLVAAYAAWVFRPEGVFAAPAVLCFRTGLVNGLVSLIAEKCRWRIVPGVVLLAFTYAAGLTLDGQPALPSRTQTYLASATAGANSVPRSFTSVGPCSSARGPDSSIAASSDRYGPGFARDDDAVFVGADPGLYAISASERGRPRGRRGPSRWPHQCLGLISASTGLLHVED